MTNPVQAVTGKDGRYYPYNGENLRSVTTHLNNLPKPFLVPWAAREVARFALPFIEDGMCVTPSYDVVKKRGYTGDYLKGADLEKYLKTEWKRQRDDAGDLGDRVHDNAEKILATYFDAPNDYDPVVWLRECARDFLRDLESRTITAGRKTAEGREYIRTAHFVKWLHSYRVEPIFVEATLFNPDGKYAGSCDLFATIDGVPTVMDLKTSKSLYPEVALQLAAYANASVLRTDDYSEHEVPKVERGAALHITDKGASFVEVDIFAKTESGVSVMDVFSTLVTISDAWLADLSKRTLVGEIAEQPVPFEGGDGE